MYIKVLFYDPKSEGFAGREYSYHCKFEEVQPGDIVRVQAKDGTSVARVSRIVEEFELGCPVGMLRDVVSFEKNSVAVPPVTEQLSMHDIEEHEEDVPEVIAIRQLPVIEERLLTIKDEIKNTVDQALSLACTDDTVKEIKKARADLNGKFKRLEEQRKAVKNQIMGPYNNFEAVYAECVTNMFAPADKKLKEKIDAVENGLKNEKRTKLIQYFNEYRDSLGVDPVICDFENIGINVRLSDTDKALKLQARCAVDQVAGDILTINGMDNADELMIEYSKCRNLNQSVAIVKARHEAIEAQKKRKAELEAQEAERRSQIDAAEQKVNDVIENTPVMEMPPQVISEAPVEGSEELPFIEFRVFGTIEQLKAIKKYLIDGGYKYEQL